MPPRIQSQRVSNSLLPYLSSPSASTTRIPLSSSSCSPSPSSSRSFSSTQHTQTQRRREMISWLQGEGAALKNHTPGQPNYLSTIVSRGRGSQAVVSRRPFPLNQAFASESILSEELRNEIYQQVVVKKKSIRAVSAEMGVDMRRVAAVCRLVEIESRWRQQVWLQFFFLFLLLLCLCFPVLSTCNDETTKNYRLVFTIPDFWACVQRL